MLDKNYLTYEEALALLLKNTPTGIIPEEEVNISDACGRVLAQDVIATENLPGFNRSTVDGFAVRSKDTFGAKETLPAYLSVKGEVLMGETPQFSLLPGECAKISTGGMLPEGADAVVMVENTNQVSEDLVEVLKPVSPWENVILEDEDVKRGEVVLKSGRILRPQDIGALAGLGVSKVKVRRKPRVSVIVTGDEIIPVEKSPKPGEVRDINSYTLRGLLKDVSAEVLNYGIVKDEYNELKSIVKEAFSNSDVVLISGGTSAGTRDMTAEIIETLGDPGILFHGVRIKPGKPLIAAVCQNKPVFGLPGHPVAVYITYKFFVEPVILRLLNATPKEITPKVKAILTRTITSQPGRRDFVRVSLEKKEGNLYASPLLSKSGLITSLVKADGLIIVPEDIPGLEKGEEVEVELI